MVGETVSKVWEVKQRVKNKHAELIAAGVDIKISKVYEKMATEHGYRDWNTYVAILKRADEKAGFITNKRKSYGK